MRLRLLTCLSSLLFFSAWTCSANPLNRDSLLAAISTAGSDSLKAELLNVLANSYINDDIGRMEHYSKQAIALARPLNHPVLTGRSHQKLGIAYMKLGQTHTGLLYLDSALYYFQKKGYTKGIAEALSNSASCYYNTGEYKKAEEKIDELLLITRLEENFHKYRIPALLLLGNIHYELKENENALNRYKEAVKLSSETKGQERNIAPILNNMAAIYGYRLNMPDSALAFLHRAEKLGYANANWDALIDICINKGDFLLKSSAGYEEAENEYRKAWSIARDKQINHQLPEILSRLADIEIRRNRVARADSMLREAEHITRGQGNLNELSKVLKHLIVVDSLRGDIQSAMSHFNEYILIRDSLLGADKKLEIKNLMMQINEREHKHRLQLLENEKEFHRTRKNFLIGILALGLVLGGLLVTLQYRAVKKTKALAAAEKSLQASRQDLLEATIKNREMEKAFLEKELDYKTQRLSDVATLLALKTELLEDVAEDLKRFQSGKEQEAVGNFLKKLDQRLQPDTARKELDVYVDATSQTFFMELENRFPGISRTEKKLCALVRLGMSNKEISALLNINPKSVEMSRYRLRKRLMIDSETNLQDFLRSFPASARHTPSE